MADGLTIGQAAAFVGVTIKTVRHYHRLGLVAEPERDGSGYRRYRSADLLRLVQVRTLAGAGVPLAEIGDLLDADPERFAAALDDVHRRLTERIEDLIARRDTLHRLDHGDRALLPDRACAVLDRLPGLGFSPDYVAGQREALVLARALVPEIFDSFLTRLEHSLDDPEFVELTKRGWDARSWDPTTRGSRSWRPRWPTSCWPTARCWRCRPGFRTSPTPPPGTDWSTTTGKTRGRPSPG